MSTEEDKLLQAMTKVYDHGFTPSGANEYQDVIDILGREPTFEEAKLLAKMNKEGFRKRMDQRFTRKIPI